MALQRKKTDKSTEKKVAPEVVEEDEGLLIEDEGETEEMADPIAIVADIRAEKELVKAPKVEEAKPSAADDKVMIQVLKAMTPRGPQVCGYHWDTNFPTVKFMPGVRARVPRYFAQRLEETGHATIIG